MIFSIDCSVIIKHMQDVIYDHDICLKMVYSCYHISFLI